MVCLVALRERPDLRPAVFSDAIQGVWPEFMRHDPTAALYFGRPHLDACLDCAAGGRLARATAFPAAAAEDGLRGGFPGSAAAAAARRVRGCGTGPGADDRGASRGGAAVGVDRPCRAVGGGGGGATRASSDPHRSHRAALSHGLLSAARSGAKPVQRAVRRPHSFETSTISPAWPQAGQTTLWTLRSTFTLRLDGPHAASAARGPQRPCDPGVPGAARVTMKG
jgi:hypothetical protein